jgi:hypothetical protein
MADAKIKQKDPEPAQDRLQPRNVPPDEVARRELVAWCEAHGLPVPPDPRVKR